MVFDGYDSGPSTKDHEHDHRTKTTPSDIQVNETLPVYCNQLAFLSNGNNKSQFITLLHRFLLLAGHTVYQAVSDADTDIIRAALDNLSSGKITTVVADDTDILVLLV